MNLYEVTDANLLWNAFKLSKKDCDWKESVQRYESNLLLNIYRTQKSIRDNEYRQKNFYTFTLNERGKTRLIKSLHISDRVIQRTICDNCISPVINDLLIYDNGASMKDKGITFTRNRLECHLQKFLRKHKEGYILKIDFSKFFDNIPHDKFLESIKPYIEEDSFKLISYLISSFKIDASNMSDEEYLSYKNKAFNMLDYKPSRKGLKYLDRSMGIGSQISQLAGIFYPSRIDNYCKIVKQCKYYGRYMDDIYIIHEDKEFLKQIYKDIQAISDDMGLFINKKKTCIINLKHGFTYLKIKYNISRSGKIIKRLSHDSIVRERRKIKKYKHLLDNGDMTLEEIRNAYASYKGNAKKYMSHKSLLSLDKLFNEIYGGL